jgi:predicted DNA binding CopG/RHH family protein
MRSTKSKKIKYGNVKLPDEAFNPKNAKFRVTMFIDLDVLNEIRKQAAKKGLPYQTYINQHLRNTVLGYEEEERIRSIVREEIKKYGSD